MPIRITQNAIAANFQSGVQSIYEKMARTQQQLSDGKRINRPSDDPFGTGQTIDFDAQLADVQQYQANVRDSIGFMDSADAGLDTITSALQSIRELAVQAANGVHSSADLQGIATQIQQLKEVVRDGINAKHGDQYVFGGTATTTAPYPSPGNAYVGTANVMSRRAAPGQSVQINVAGDSVLNPQPGNTFDIIDQLVVDVQGGNIGAISADIGSVQGEIDRTLDVRTLLGASANRLEVMQDRLAAMEERLTSARTDVADVDATEAYVKFTQQNSMYQAALAAGTKMMQTSILDFI